MAGLPFVTEMHAGEREPRNRRLLTMPPGQNAGLSAAVNFIWPDVHPAMRGGDIIPRQHTARREQHCHGRRRKLGVETLQKRRTADKYVAPVMGQRRQLFGVVEHCRVQRQPLRQG
ncbi:hypothetical protein D3C72_1024760 [compost metagenome]